MARKAASLPPATETELGPETWKYVGRKIKNILPLFLLSYVPAFSISTIYSKLLNPAYSATDIGNNFISSLSELCFVSMGGFVTYLANGVSWFFSALFLSTAILYPILRRYYHSFIYIVAPLACIFSLGYISQTYGELNLWIQAYNGFYYPGMLRALIVVSLGAVAYEISNHVTIRVRWWVPVCLYFVAAFLMVIPITVSNHDFLVLGILFFAVILTFRAEELPIRIYHFRAGSRRDSSGHPNGAWTQKLSVALILNHIYVFYFYECIGMEAPNIIKMFICLVTVFMTSCGMLALEQRILSLWREKHGK